MKRPFLTGVHNKHAKIHVQNISREQMQRLLRDIFAPNELSLDDAKALMQPLPPKVKS